MAPLKARQELHNAKLKMLTMKECCSASYGLLGEHEQDHLADKEEHTAAVFDSDEVSILSRR